MSERDSLYSLLKRALDGDDEERRPVSSNYAKLTLLEQQLAERDAKIADLRSLVTVLWLAIFGILLIWGLREWLSS